MRRVILRAVPAIFLAVGAAHAAPPSVGGCQIFPADNYWNTPVDTLPLHPSSAAWVTTVGSGRVHADWGLGPPTDDYGIPFTTVTGAQPLVAIVPDPDPDWDFSDESDPGPYPIPPNAPVEGGLGAPADADRHVIVIDTTNCFLYELYHAFPLGNGSWQASSFVKWNLASNASRPAGWTSADASGLPVFPGLVRRAETLAGEINHAIRFTAAQIWGRENGQQKYLWPARHASGTSTIATRPPMGARFRLKASFDTVNKPGGGTYHAETQVIMRAMKKYGMVLVDGGSNWYFQGVSDPGWPSQVFSELNNNNALIGSAFEVVDTSGMMIDVNSMKSVQPGSDLGFAQVANPATASTGKDVVFTVTASNAGPGAVVAPTFTATLGAPFVWASPGCSHASGTVACTLPTIAAGTSTSVRIVLRPLTAGTAMLTLSGPFPGDPNGANNFSVLNINVNPSPAGTPVQRYRLYSNVTKEHHFTTDLNEYNVLGSYVGTWVQEGTVGSVFNNPGTFNGVAGVPYYRLYDSNTLWHHWTTDANEYYTLGYVYAGWNLEGVDGYIFPTPAAGLTQLYRLNYPALGSLHHWTIDANEYNTLITPQYGWVGEGGAGFVIQ